MSLVCLSLIQLWTYAANDAVMVFIAFKLFGFELGAMVSLPCAHASTFLPAMCGSFFNGKWKFAGSWQQRTTDVARQFIAIEICRGICWEIERCASYFGGSELSEGAIEQFAARRYSKSRRRL